MWAKAGGVPGTRACIREAEDLWSTRRLLDARQEAVQNGEPKPGGPNPACRAHYADSRYHAAARSHRCPQHPDGLR